MTWRDRLVEAAYTAPSGERITFEYEDVSRRSEKKTAAFNFADANGTYIQDNGTAGRQYPVLAIFSGPDYDIAATAFERILLEKGTGILEHPSYGAQNVVPFGSINRRDNLTSKANQAIVEVSFFDTTDIAYPTAQSDPGSEVISAVNNFNNAAAQEFSDVTDLAGAVPAAQFKNNYLSLLDSAQTGLQSIANTQKNVNAQFKTITDSINLGIDVLVKQPLTLAFQTSIMVQAPSRALTDIRARLDAYKTLAATITSGNLASTKNQFRTQDLYAMSYVTGSVLSTINNQFTTKTEAIEAAQEVLSQLDTVVNWRDNNLENLDEIDQGAAYQQLQEAVALTAGFLVEISFTLKQERRITLNRARTIIDLASELYGSIDDQLDFLISSNDLSGDEILELPEGREIVYYI